jgi:dihydropteroate synthase
VIIELPSDRPALMGILNVTPDSFSEQGLNFKTQDAIDAGLRMVLDEGADLLDVGGESTRPGAAPVSEEEEIRRVAPVIEALAAIPLSIPISIDTRKPAVAKAALSAGARIVNDVTALEDPEMQAVCDQGWATVCLMHMKGAPQTMQANPVYEDVVSEVLAFLIERAGIVQNAGITAARIWIDPGIGFGKTPMHNLELLHNLSRFVETGFPVLIGVSRKSSIGVYAGGAPVDQRLPGTLAAQVLAQHAGVRIIRAHDVKAARQAIDVAAAILKPSSFSKRPA